MILAEGTIKAIADALRRVDREHDWSLTDPIWEMIERLERLAPGDRLVIERNDRPDLVGGGAGDER